MTLYNQKNECCGCRACVEICPPHAISFQQDKEGFFYPTIDEDQCIHCKKCLEVCPIKHTDVCSDKHLYYGARNKDESIREKSSSGGIFSALANYIFSKSGSVFAAGYDDKMNVVHMEITEAEKLDRVRRSKYVQSDMNSVYRQIRRRLQEGKWVLFAGTPCQTEAVRRFVSVKYDKLILIDLVCYGASSPGVWRKYIDYLERKHRGRIQEYSFRDKRNKNNAQTVSWKNTKTEKSYPLSSDPYSRMYFRNVIIRPSCFSCPYCRPERNSDFTIGDFWGIEKIRPDLEDGMGNSLVILHSDKAYQIWNELQDQIRAFSCERADVLQPRLLQPTDYPENRKKFMKLYKYVPFSFMVKLYSKKRK